MTKPILMAFLSLGSLVVFGISFGVMLKKCDGVLRAYCVDQRLAALAAAATIASIVGLIMTVITWKSLPTWLHIAGISIPVVILGVWIKETIFSL